ncbi:MAG: MerR family transcriptional regulator [Oscillospiraceae bacterium]|nr:MerR family transcriptional regulator [Oscillospiraceae bacterium]
MNIVQCQFCRKPFAGLGGRTCPECQEQMDKDFITVREYIYENKHANIDVISEETEVPKRHIIHLLKEGRLILNSVDDSGGGVIFCEVCKKPIKTGRMCKECMVNVSSVIDRNIPDRRPQQSARPSSSDQSVAKLGK